MPLARRVPKICDGLASLIRFITTEEMDGWLKTVVSPAAMLKLCQLSIATGEVVMVSREPFCDVVAVPEATVMPVGLASAHSTQRRKAAKTQSQCRMPNLGWRIGWLDEWINGTRHPAQRDHQSINPQIHQSIVRCVFIRG